MIRRSCPGACVIVNVFIMLSVICIGEGSITTLFDSYTTATSLFSTVPYSDVTSASFGSSISVSISDTSMETSDASMRILSTAVISDTLSSSSFSSSTSINLQFSFINATSSSVYSSSSFVLNSSLSTFKNSSSSALNGSLFGYTSLSLLPNNISSTTLFSLPLLSNISSATFISSLNQVSTSLEPISSTLSDTSMIHSTPHGSTTTAPFAKQTTSDPSTLFVQLTTKSTFLLNPSVTLKSVAKTSSSVSTTMLSSTFPYMVAPPTPGQIMKPPLTLSTLNQCGIGSCCTYGLSQLPGLLVFDESKIAGSVLVPMRDVYNVTFSVKVKRPKELKPLLDNFFNITRFGKDHVLILKKQIDLEGLYERAGKKMDVHMFQLEISCVDHVYTSLMVPPRLLNVTIDDVDDNMPIFNHPDQGSSGCEVPVYKTKTSEDFTGVLNVNPQQIRAVDGDLTMGHNISYHVMHSEPDDYHVFFNVDEDTGTINKTTRMNSSDPNKYVIFIQAVEDSPQQKSRVAILSITVVAPDPPLDPSKVNPIAKLSVQIACVFIFMAFICGIAVIVHHRYRQSHQKVYASNNHDEVERDVRLPKLAVYNSSNSSLNSAMPEVPIINSPSQVTLDDGPTKQWLELPTRESESQKKRRVIVVKKPLDTSSRPNWNAPSPKPKRTTYNPFTPYQTTRRN